MQRHIPVGTAVRASRPPSPTDGNTDTDSAPASGRGTIRIADLTELPPTVDVETAARILGCGRTLAYELVKRGEFPCPVLRLGKRHLVPTAGLLEALGLHAHNAQRPHSHSDRVAP